MVRAAKSQVPTRLERAGRLREALRRRDVGKLYGLAVDLGVDQSAISRWRNGGAMSLEHTAALCLHLEISMDWLVLGRGDMQAGMAAADPDEASRMVDLLRKMEPDLRNSFRHIMQAVKIDSDNDAFNKPSPGGT